MKKIIISLICIAALLVVAFGVPVSASSPGNKDKSMQAYYDGKLFFISFMEKQPTAEAKIDMKNKSINKIYQYDPGLPGGAPFISVIDAIQGQGPGFNPLWEEFQIVFNHPSQVPVHQYTSDNDIVNDFNAGLIGLIETDEIYVCVVKSPVSGPGPKGK